MKREITSSVYDENIISEGMQLQIDNYYEPKSISAQKRINVVMDLIAPKPHEKILDIGCGVGTFAFHCAKLGAVSTGIDYSKESIKIAQKICEQYNMKNNPMFVTANVMNLPFDNSYFDKIVTADFIEHITHEEKEVLLKEIYRVLKPGGIAVIFTPNGLREKIGEIYWKTRQKIFKNKIPVTDLHFGLINKNHFEKLLKKYKFVFKLYYKDITRPYLAKLPFLKNYLALNLLWTIKKT